ncbi:hypothetical protein A2246_04000 [candidate division WOR-1 bacterium RIFOXYA2_FULL_37_7]|uniref:Nucleotidyl transferase AbiEii/AbiGii toxin family protein n=1 Tax=candidate division WOR-1 bacterium RIFOXYB2_FULL_37_13 TaxID=1802579 RepID=A0A1F4SEG7_UNCSA|nr:MAG: hypothetical protein A2246_04000 [candidate division WOR-1 bacterium RIFOXYA2_FULL_37_7]OGC18822.1 MAG: hypothetical protein A2310_08315 [candidate division WOR-1 bacterium RIFOXYB2_FULL_37_13]
MDNNLRKVQLKCLKAFSGKAKNFALAGGTALELYYLHHRFSFDLDFFSTSYELEEIDSLVVELQKALDAPLKLENELSLPQKAKIRFYTAMFDNLERPLKLDFVQDVFFKKPKIEKFKGVRVYSAENIYMQKIIAISGLEPEIDEVGKELMHGRMQARDVFDLYMLSKKIEPLHIFLKSVSSQLQRGLIHWYRAFPREEMKLALLDLEIYDPTFDSRQMIAYLESEIKTFIKEVVP